MKNLFAILACVGAQASEALLEKLFRRHNPNRQRRGGFGYGIFVAVRDRNGCGAPRGVNIRINPASPLTVVGTSVLGEYRIEKEGQQVADISLFPPEEWTARQLSNGRPITEVLQQHTGRNLVGVIGGTRCPLFDRGNPCSFCSLRGGEGNLERSVEETLEALGVIMIYRSTYILTLTTPLLSEQGFAEVCGGLARIKEAFPALPVALESQPVPPSLMELLKSSGIDTWMIPLDCYGEEAQTRYIPGKSPILQKWYWSAAERAVTIWGEGNVIGNLIVGLEPEEVIQKAIREMVQRGVVPDPLPIRPTERLRIETDPAAFVHVQSYVREEMQRSGLAYRMGTVKAGCAACGGCGGGVSANTLRRRLPIVSQE